MDLTAEQKQTVANWIEEGLNLAEIQRRLGSEFALPLTYMEARFLIDDLQLAFKKPPVPEPEPAAATVEAGFDAVESPSAPAAESPFAPETFAPARQGVAVKVDAITRPGSLVSGSVVFSDGNKATWYLDQTGRLGMVTEEVGYRPPQADVAEFQRALEKELVKMGM